MNPYLSRKIGRLRKHLTLILRGHILNAPWLSRIERRKRRYEATLSAALKYLDRYKNHIAEIEPGDSQDSEEPERVYTIWFQGEEAAPPLVKACFESMRRRSGMEVVVLDRNTLPQWTDLPDEIIDKWRKGKMRDAHFSDICRVNLLYLHGGIWLDATDYVTSEVPEWIMKENFFIYHAGSKIRGSYSYVQNCFIRAKKHNPLIKIWHDAIIEYWRNENSVINYFTHQLLFRMAVTSNSTARMLYEKMPKKDQDPTHALWHGHSTDSYSPQLYRELTKDSFFQKTSYKDKCAVIIPKGTVADHIINGGE